VRFAGSEVVPVTTAFGAAEVVDGWVPPSATESNAVVEAEARAAESRQAARTVRMPRPPERPGGGDAVASPEGAACAEESAGVSGSAIACRDAGAGSARWESDGVESNGSTGTAS
jgi:hypothetical protein